MARVVETRRLRQPRARRRPARPQGHGDPARRPDRRPARHAPRARRVRAHVRRRRPRRAAALRGRGRLARRRGQRRRRRPRCSARAAATSCAWSRRDRLGRPRLHLRAIGSTNARARELAAAGAPHGTLVTAGEQTAGRGRQGRGWSTPPGSALALSLVIRDPDPLLSLRAGLAVADLAGAGARVKWPNDVLLDGRKVAGVLVEGRPQEGWAVLGIGVNAALDLAALPEELRARRTLGLAPAERRARSSCCGARARCRRADARRAARARRAAGRPAAGGEGTGAGSPRRALLVRGATGGHALDAGEVHLLEVAARPASSASGAPSRSASASRGRRIVAASRVARARRTGRCPAVDRRRRAIPGLDRRVASLHAIDHAPTARRCRRDALAELRAASGQARAGRLLAAASARGGPRRRRGRAPSRPVPSGLLVGAPAAACLARSRAVARLGFAAGSPRRRARGRGVARPSRPARLCARGQSTWRAWRSRRHRLRPPASAAGAASAAGFARARSAAWAWRAARARAGLLRRGASAGRAPRLGSAGFRARARAARLGLRRLLGLALGVGLGGPGAASPGSASTALRGAGAAAAGPRLGLGLGRRRRSGRRRSSAPASASSAARGRRDGVDLALPRALLAAAARGALALALREVAQQLAGERGRLARHPRAGAVDDLAGLGGVRQRGGEQRGASAAGPAGARRARAGGRCGRARRRRSSRAARAAAWSPASAGRRTPRAPRA